MKKFFLVFILLLLSFDVFSQGSWVQQTSPVSSDFNGCWAVNTDICWMCGNDKYVIRTTNGGAIWLSVGTSIQLTTNFNCVFAFDADRAFVGSYDGYIFRTTNGGNSWTIVNLTPPSPFFDAIHFFDANTGFILGDPYSVTAKWMFYITTNGGASWSLGLNAPPAATGEFGFPNSYCALDTGHIWWGTNSAKIWKGSFRGPFVSCATAGSQNSFALCFNNDSTGDACFLTGPVKISKTGGLTWMNGIFIPPQIPWGLKGIPNTNYMWICGGNTSGFISRSTDNGTFFSQQLTMSSNALCISMANINCGWVGTAAGKIYKYTDNVGIEPPISTPTTFELKQNYPNPFNPTTTIDFSLAQTGYITLKVYNLLGQEVVTLIDGVKTAGAHNVIFDASSLPSGTYFYTMKSGDNVATKTLVLVK